MPKWLPRPRYTIRGIMLATLATAVVFAFLGGSVRRRWAVRNAAKAITERGGRVFYHTGSCGDEWWPGRETDQSKMLADPSGVELSNLEITQEMLIHLDAFDRLRWVSLSRSTVRDRDLRCLHGIDSLEQVFLDHTEITDAGLREVASLVSLHVLYLDGTRVSDGGLIHLQGLRDLRVLSLADNRRITGRGFVHLIEMTRLEYLDLRNTGVDDSAIPHLARLQSLEYLSLRGTKVCDDGITALRTLRKLRRVDLRATQASNAGVETLRRALPHTAEVLHDSPPLVRRE